MKTADYDYDIIIAGAGAAGLSLAAAFVQSSWRDKKILLIEPEFKDKNDRTWCFWSEDAGGLAAIASHRWDQINFISPQYQSRIEINPYSYWMVRGIDFYNAMQTQIRDFPNVSWLSGKVTHIFDGQDMATVQVGDRTFTASWVFDSRPPILQEDQAKHHYLKQHFRGWVIETALDVFDPSAATLFDFRTEQKSSMRFMYTLPFSARQALVEYTIFSEQLLKEEDYQKPLQDYFRDVLQLKDFKILEVEQGAIPMTDQPLPRRSGERVMAIGTAGGRVKPSSGYAFLRIQKDTAAIVRSLEISGHPFYKDQTAGRYHWFDRIMLQVMKREGGRMAAIFTALFQKNSIQDIFRFLDERGSWLQDLKIISSLPWAPFLRALWRLVIGTVIVIGKR